MSDTNWQESPGRKALIEELLKDVPVLQPVVFSPEERMAQAKRLVELEQQNASLTRQLAESEASRERMRKTLQYIATSCPINDEPLASHFNNKAKEALKDEPPSAALKALLEPVREAVESITEYWNGCPESAVDAIEHAQEKAQSTLKAISGEGNTYPKYHEPL